VEQSVQFTDIEVTKRKFKKELENFLRLENDWRLKGVFLIKDSFPLLEFLFTAPKLTPPSVVYCIRIDFCNYDIEAPSIRFIHPYTGAELTRQEININFWQMNLPANYQSGMPVVPLDLLQGRPQDIPFICIRGVREYHNHPAHTGDSWLMYRGRGEGTLGYILDQLYNFSIEQLQSYGVDLQVNIKYNQVPKVSISQ
jgi:hypothetical protein